jgi:hypothetical protein
MPVVPEGENVKVSLIYRIACVLLVLFAAGHTLGFRKIDPRWGIEPLISNMRNIHFNAQGFNRSYWDFYVGFGLLVSLFLLFAAVLSWQLGGLTPESLQLVKGIRWSLAVCFAGVAILSWRYFFVVPVLFSVVICLCLIVAAIL